MHVHRWLAGCVVALAVASPAKASQAPLRIVGPPLITYDTTYGNLDVWLRLNRPLKHNIGHPSEYTGGRASIEVAGFSWDVVGLERRHLRPTCYGEGLFPF